MSRKIVMFASRAYFVLFGLFHLVGYRFWEVLLSSSALLAKKIRFVRPLSSFCFLFAFVLIIIFL